MPAARPIGVRRHPSMLVVRATKKLLQLVHRPAAEPDAEADTLLGCWYATVMYWRPRVVLLVNESTLVPALMPLARRRPCRVASATRFSLY